MMKNNLLFSILLATVFVFAAPAVMADGQYGQYGQYGGPSAVTSLSIDKKVGIVSAATKGGVASVTYVDNLSPADTRFKPGSQVMFQVTVTNTSNVGLSGINVTDYVPSYVEPMEGPGNFNSASRTVSWDAGSFKPGESKVYYLKMQLYGQAQLPADKGLFCLTNKAQAVSGSISDSDTAQFCVEKEVVGVTKAPAAGPEDGILLFGLQSVALGIGYTLKKLSAKK